MAEKVPNENALSGKIPDPEPGVDVSGAEAYCLFRDFEPAPAASFCTPYHYLLYASSGRMRLEAQGQAWTLPPARAALIAADTPILVTLTARVTANSALFSQTFVAPPRHHLSVFEVTPLVRELLRECRAYTSPTEPLDEYATPLFRALATVCWRQAQSPSPAVMPVAKSEALVRVLQLTESKMAAPPSFEQLAGRVGLASRSLARRFQEELGMTWREALRRMRMIRAIERLVDSDASASITEIAFDVGYSSLSAFNTAFREFAGMTPSDYRRSFLPRMNCRGLKLQSESSLPIVSEKPDRAAGRLSTQTAPGAR